MFLSSFNAGQLVCIFRSLPRLVKAIPQDLSATPSMPLRGADGVPRLFQSPLQLSDAVRRLAFAALNQHSFPRDYGESSSTLKGKSREGIIPSNHGNVDSSRYAPTTTHRY